MKKVNSYIYFIFILYVGPRYILMHFTCIGSFNSYAVKEASLLPQFYTHVRKLGTSLVAQWLRIQLPIQGTQVRSLVQGDSACHRAAKPVSCSY